MNKEQLEQNIKNMEAEIAKMKEELNKPEKFKFKYKENGKTFLLGEYKVYDNYSGTREEYLGHYRYRISEDNTKAELLRNKQGNFIGALFEQIDENYAEDINWDNTNEKYHLAYYTDTMKWFVESRKYSKLPEVVYTSELEVAERAVELLNSGQVEYPQS